LPAGSPMEFSGRNMMPVLATMAIGILCEGVHSHVTIGIAPVLPSPPKFDAEPWPVGAKRLSCRPTAIERSSLRHATYRASMRRSPAAGPVTVYELPAPPAPKGLVEPEPFGWLPSCTQVTGNVRPSVRWSKTSMPPEK